MAATDLVSSGPEIVDHMGIRLPLHPTISPGIAESIRTGRYERTEGKLLPAMIERGERVVDLGGGLGFTAAVMARTGRAELVVCIEAHPGLVPLIEQLRELNGLNFEIRNLVVSPVQEAPTATFYMHKNFWGSSLLPVAQENLLGLVEIPTISFAELARTYSPTMYVVDIEVLRAILAPRVDGTDRLDALDLVGVDKVVVQVHRSVAGAHGVKRVFDWFSAREFVYSPVHSRGDVVLFERLNRLSP